MMSPNPKPKPSGRAITEYGFIEELTSYEPSGRAITDDGFIEELTSYEQASATSGSRLKNESQQPWTQQTRRKGEMLRL